MVFVRDFGLKWCIWRIDIYSASIGYIAECFALSGLELVYLEDWDLLRIYRVHSCMFCAV